MVAMHTHHSALQRRWENTSPRIEHMSPPVIYSRDRDMQKSMMGFEKRHSGVEYGWPFWSLEEYWGYRSADLGKGKVVCFWTCRFESERGV
jgi:hypothetical protein